MSRLFTEEELVARAKRIKWLVLDVDGVLTDGGIIYSERGDETKRFHVRDGAALKIWTSLGLNAAIITGRSSELVSRRAAELGIAPVIQGQSNKWQAFQGLLKSQRIVAEDVCAFGDDLPETSLFAHTGLSVAVADACAELRELACHVTEAKGGYGAVREGIEWLLKLKGHWSTVVDSFRFDL